MPSEGSDGIGVGNQRAVGCASARHFHQSNISTVFIESIESAPFDNPALRN
ncbi:hypothetical protein [Neisseria maigaei]|uniref:hypothetical protein n=1 Tax=Neisseria maigaei TaxID=2830651 RepID=UPI002658CFBB|nr:hypothetical protein [Neisseria maigaei]